MGIRVDRARSDGGGVNCQQSQAFDLNGSVHHPKGGTLLWVRMPADTVHQSHEAEYN